MTTPIDLNDIPQVQGQDLIEVMQALIARQHGLILVNGLTADNQRALEDIVWSAFPTDPAKRLSVLMRMTAVIGVFQSRRLKSFFLAKGLAVSNFALQIAAKQRLNINWGFNSQSFLMALHALTKDATSLQHRRATQPVVRSTLSIVPQQIAA